MTSRFYASAALAFLTLSVVGCVNWTDPGLLQARQTDDLCQGYYLFSGRVVIGVVPTASYPERLDAIKKELEARNAVTPQDWPLIDAGRVQKGMTACAVEAVWGATTLHEQVGDLDA